MARRAQRQRGKDEGRKDVIVEAKNAILRAKISLKTKGMIIKATVIATLLYGSVASLVQGLVPCRIYALSILSSIGSVAEPDPATIAAENLALQRPSAGPLHHSIPSALHRRGSACGLKIVVDGIQLTSKASRFRVASQSGCLTTGVEHIRAAKDHGESTLEAITRSWDEKYLHTATAFHTTASFRLVGAMDSLPSLGNLPPRKMQSGASALIRQSDSILDVATPPLQPTLARLALWWAPSESHLMVCARLPDSLLLKKTQDAFWGATTGSIAFGITIDVPLISNSLVPSGLALANAF